jgi:hypothetical protein
MFNITHSTCLRTGQFKKKVTLSHVHNEVTSEPTITRYTTIVRKTLKDCLQYVPVCCCQLHRCTVVTELVFANCRIQNAFCCGVAILQHGLPWRRWPETVSRINYKRNLRVFLTIVLYRVIVGSLVTSL